MSTVDYLPFATGGGANVITQITYVTLPARTTGFLPGLADASQANKVWRQSGMMSAAMANVISQELGIDVLDDGDLPTLIANLKAALAQVAKMTRIVTSSAPLVVAKSDYRVVFNRTVAPAATAVTLPTPDFIGQEFRIEDGASNFSVYPVTVLPPGGMTIAGGPNFACNQDRQSVGFAYNGSNLWTVDA